MTCGSREVLDQHHRTRLDALAIGDPAHHALVSSILFSSQHEEDFHRSHRPPGKCNRCPERKYLVCGLSDRYCVDTCLICQNIRGGKHMLIGEVKV